MFPIGLWVCAQSLQPPLNHVQDKWYCIEDDEWCDSEIFMTIIWWLSYCRTIAPPPPDAWKWNIIRPEFQRSPSPTSAERETTAEANLMNLLSNAWIFTTLLFFLYAISCLALYSYTAVFNQCRNRWEGIQLFNYYSIFWHIYLSKHCSAETVLVIKQLFFLIRV